MEVSGVVFRPTQCFNGGLFNTHSSKISFSGCSSINRVNRVLSNLSIRPRKSCGFGGSTGFSDNGHLKYYGSTRCDGKKTNKEELLVKEKNAEKKKIKKKLKYLKGLSRNMLMFPEMSFVDDNRDGSVQDDMRKTISEATTILLAQLKQTKTEQKMQKRKRKEEKKKLKAAQMKTTAEKSDSSSSSSSSESSDSEGEMVVNMSRLRSSALAEPPTRTERKPQTSIQAQPPTLFLEESKSESPLGKFQMEEESYPSCQSQLTSEPKIQVRVEPPSSSPSEQNSCCSSATTSVRSATCSGGAAKAERIDVCVGGKCRKMGGAALLEEFERRVGVEGSVVGCKCMGKCRNGPNVRVHTFQDKGVQGSNPLYIGVGLEDVTAIVSKFWGEKRTDLNLMAT